MSLGQGMMTPRSLWVRVATLLLLAKKSIRGAITRMHRAVRGLGDVKDDLPILSWGTLSSTGENCKALAGHSTAIFATGLFLSWKICRKVKVCIPLVQFLPRSLRSHKDNTEVRARKV